MCAPLLTLPSLVSSSQDSDEDEVGEEGKRRKVAEKTKTVAFEIQQPLLEIVKKRASVLDCPLMEEYDFRSSSPAPLPNFTLRPLTKIRKYQERSLSRMFGNGRARSGIIVLPCGAGKTLTGCTAAQTIGKSTIVLCTNAVSCLQWKAQFELWTTIGDGPNENDGRIACFTSQIKDKMNNTGCVLVTTYTMLTWAGKRAPETEKYMEAIRAMEWGCMLLDEVHVVPAETFRRVIATVKSHTKLGLTATLVREDDKIADLNFLIGPKLYEANWMDLTAQGYLANVKCLEVWCPLSRPFMEEYLKPDADMRRKQLLYTMCPSKIRCTEYLIKKHEARGDKIIVFSDLVFTLDFYAKKFGRPAIHGATPEHERNTMLGEFKAGDIIQTLFLSKVGDTSIDLPEANVIIQISSHFGSRRQEAQRLGRILRPKAGTATDGTNKDSFNAFFYTLVTTDTSEMYYSTKRQQYLVDQGYTFQVITDLHDKAHKAAKESDPPGLCATDKEERDLLRDLLSHSTDAAQMEKAENAVLTKESAEGNLAIQRSGGTGMAGMAGGAGMSYSERTISRDTPKNKFFRARRK